MFEISDWRTTAWVLGHVGAGNSDGDGLFLLSVGIWIAVPAGIPYRLMPNLRSKPFFGNVPLPDLRRKGACMGRFSMTNTLS